MRDQSTGPTDSVNKLKNFWRNKVGLDNSWADFFLNEMYIHLYMYIPLLKKLRTEFESRLIIRKFILTKTHFL